MTSLDLSSTSDIIPFDQNWHHLYLASAGGKEGKSLQQNKKKRRKRKGEKKLKIEKLKNVGHLLIQKLSQNFDFCACLSQNVVKRDSSGKEG